MTVAKAPHSWDFLVRAVQKGGVEGLAALGRSKETLRAYQERKAEILSEFDTIADHVLVNLLGVPSTRGHEQGKRKADRSKLTQVNKLVYTLNDFPYYVEPGIEHGVVWSTGKLREKEMLALLDEKLSGRERIYFINPPSLQSVAEVEHAHVFSRDASTDSKTEP